MRLADKVAIITGAGSGMGRASALRFAEEGAKVVIADIDPKGGQETVDMVRDRGGDAVFVEGDVSEESDMNDLVRTTIDNYAKLNILFNNAGYPQLGKPFETIDAQEWKRIMDVNLYGMFLGSKCALAELKKVGNGVILNTTSVAGINPRPGSSVYATAKGAAITLTKVLANELGPFRIRVNSIAPGPTETPMLPLFMDLYNEDVRNQIAAGLPLRRIVQPDEIANTALFLASDEAAAITGIVLPVDCGLHIGRGKT
jgi:3-oxoacyl-[acyl-carrier protein] reductase